jgi:hypothetical protein
MSDGWIPALMFMTLAAGAGFGLLQLFWFMERRSNRLAGERGLIGTDSPSDHGALPELAGVGAVAVIAMVLLTVGYNFRDNSPPVAAVPAQPTPASATEQMTDPARPRANPAEFSQPPTQYPLGSGSPATAPTEPAPPPAAPN